MNKNDAFEYKDMGLQALIKALGESSPSAKVGILGGAKARTEGSSDKHQSTNAEIGARHEFGSTNLPVRSFLRMPISLKMQTYLDNSKLLTPEVIKNVIQEKSLEQIVSILGILGESIVLEAFTTGGFGKWKASNMTNKKNQETLVETQQLRNSISSEVIK